MAEDVNEIREYKFTKKGHYPSGYEEGQIVKLPIRCARGYEHWVPVDGSSNQVPVPENVKTVVDKVNLDTGEPVVSETKATEPGPVVSGEEKPEGSGNEMVDLMFPPRGKKKAVR